MDDMTRFAVYYAPRPGPFADATAAWLGWDLARGQPVDQPTPALPRPLSDITRAPRRYGFHGTIKPPFRLAKGLRPEALVQATAELAARLAQVTLPGLHLPNLHLPNLHLPGPDLPQADRFLALTPTGDTAPLQALAATVVQVLDPFRAELTEAEILRRRPDRLTARQRDLLATFGYPHVMEEFRFHLTLTGTLNEAEHPAIAAAAAAQVAGLLPEPFRIADLCLCGEDADGRFHLLHRFALST
ncbi:MAG: DUF1045 domain-containing protein [Pseudomonadota bacterium]